MTVMSREEIFKSLDDLNAQAAEGAWAKFQMKCMEREHRERLRAFCIAIGFFAFLIGVAVGDSIHEWLH